MVLEQKTKRRILRGEPFSEGVLLFAAERILSGYGIKAWDGIEKACQKREFPYIMIQTIIGK